MSTKLIYNRTKKSASNPMRTFSKTGDFFIAIGEALDSNNPKSELQKLAKKYNMDLVDLKDAVETYLNYDLEWEKEKIKPVMKKCGFSGNTKEYWVLYEYKSPMAKSSTKYELEEYIQKHHGGSPTKEAYTIKKMTESELPSYRSIPDIDDIDY